MAFSTLFTLVLFVVLIIFLIGDWIKPVYVFGSASLLLILTNVIGVSDFIDAFANKSILSIFILIFLTRLLKDNYNFIGWVDDRFKNVKSVRWFILKFSLIVSACSSFMNNTPIVALMTPYVYQWGNKHKVSPSKLLLPLSFAAITGGMITVIGTSTNLVLNGFLEANGQQVLSISNYLVPGIIVSVLAAIYSSTIGFKLLPSTRKVEENQHSDLKEYLIETKVQPSAIINGKTVEQAGLRNLEGLFLAEIVRNGEVITPVTPETILFEGDRLYFAGESSAVVQLEKSDKGITWAKNDKFELKGELDLVEVVIPYNSKLAGVTLKEYQFREKFDSAVVAIHRNGESISGKLGNVKLKYGDLMILTAGKKFKELSGRQKDIYLISGLGDGEKQVSNWQRKVFPFIALVFILLSVFKVITFFVALLSILGMAIGFNMTNSKKIKEELNLELLGILGSAIALGSALIQTGASEIIAHSFLEIFTPLGETGIMVGLLLLTVILTSFVTNVAAVSIVFPVAYTVVGDLGVDGGALYTAIAFGASAAFLTPVSYQTNLMVAGPGAYVQKDFIRYGAPMMMMYLITIIGYLLIT